MDFSLLKVFSDSITTQCPGSTQSCDTGIPKVSANSGEIQIVLQIVFGIIGAIAVLIIVINGLQLVISQGSPDALKKARDAIIAASIGLVIAVSAEIIVTFVLTKLSI
jgi:hypothetical protein